MTTQCARCKEYFLGESHAWNMKNEPFCASCFNELAYGKPKDITADDIMHIDSAPEDFSGKGYRPPPPPPTMA